MLPRPAALACARILAASNAAQKCSSSSESAAPRCHSSAASSPLLRNVRSTLSSFRGSRLRLAASTSASHPRSRSAAALRASRRTWILDGSPPEEVAAAAVFFAGAVFAGAVFFCLGSAAGATTSAGATSAGAVFFAVLRLTGLAVEVDRLEFVAATLRVERGICHGGALVAAVTALFEIEWRLLGGSQRTGSASRMDHRKHTHKHTRTHNVMQSIIHAVSTSYTTERGVAAL